MNKKDKDKLVFSVFILMCLAAGLRTTKEIDECFSWAIGEDWEHIPMKEWRERAMRRIGLSLSKDTTFERAIEAIINKWKEQQNEDK